MKKLLCILLILILILASCNTDKLHNYGASKGENMGYDYYAIDMNTAFPLPTTLSPSDGERARVIILIGQSNATGCSLTSYLRDAVGEEKYLEFEAGYDNVLINFSLDDQKYSSGGEFVPVDLSCAAGAGCFGPELGMAETLSAAFSDEKIFILKFSMSGYSLNYHWLYDGERASVYNAFLEYATTYIDALVDLGYDIDLEAVCWMQGESDTTEFKAARYYSNTEKLVSYLRSDLLGYGDGDIYFIDAGISASPYCEPAYPEINDAKRRYSMTSDINVYFSTIDAGLTTLYEPEGEPDLGHYDAASELTLGRMFGSELIKILKTEE